MKHDALALPTALVRISLSQLLIRLQPALILLAILLVATTAGLGLLGVAPGDGGRLARAADLRIESNVATWFSSVLILVLATSFALLGWAPLVRARMHVAITWFYRMAALGCLYLSADEVGMLHEQAGTKLAHAAGLVDAGGDGLFRYGIRWVVLYAPVALLGATCVILAARRALASLRPERRPRTAALLAVGLGALVAVLGCETFESYLRHSGRSADALTCLEEACEVTGFLCLFVAHSRLARSLGA